MNAIERARVSVVRNAIARMDEDETPNSSGTLWTVGKAKDLCDGSRKPVPTHINMGTVLAERRKNDAKHGCATLGCIAGVTVALYPAEAKAEWDKEKNHARFNPAWPDRFSSIGRILGLDTETASTLFFGRGSKHEASLEDIPKDDVLNALDGVLAGREPSKLWAN